MPNKKRLKWLYRRLETLKNAEGGTRTTFVGFLDGLVKCASWLLKPDRVIYLSIVV